MMRRFFRFLVPLCLILLAGCGGMAAATGQDGKPPLALEPCQLSAPSMAEYLPAKCTTLTVFENRAAQSGRTIDVHIAVVPAIGRGPAPDPLFFLAGGPGQAASESYPLLAPALAEINQQRDIVLIDQRGTGQSHQLRCAESAALLPLLIHTTYATGDKRLLAAQALLISDQLDGMINSGVNLSVLCAEDAPFFNADQVRAANSGAYLGDSETDGLGLACAAGGR